MMDLTQALGKRLLFVDGAMGTLLIERGLHAGEAPETWNHTHPEEVEAIHRAYLDAGCDILTANTFGANRYKLEGRPVRETVEAALELAKRARGGRPAWIAMDIGPTGRLLRPSGDLDFEEAYEAFAEAAQAGAAAGADLMLIETMSDTYEMKAAVLAAKETGLPVFATMAFDQGGRLLTGGGVDAAVALLEGLGVDALGMNCGMGPAQMLSLLPRLREAASLPLMICPNAGLPRRENGRDCYDVPPEEFAAALRRMAEGGAWVLGGCCGTTPGHLAAARRACAGLSPLPLEPKRRTVVSSYTHAVALGEHPVIIGERINPTGKKRFQQALREGDLEYLLREGVTQQQNGAQILDVNVGLPGLDEKSLLCRAVEGLQSVCSLPLQIDTADPCAMEAAMRRYNGKPLLNSVSGKEESMRRVFPLMKRYGGVAVALTLDENGIPGTAEGRFAIAETIVRTAEAHGIGRENLVIDVLAMTISADQSSARTALDALRLVRERLGVATVLGVSNISFGLPQREALNAAFLLLALQNGLSAAILNPNAEAMRRAFDAYRALSGDDPQCQDYLARYAGQAAQPAPAPQETPTLREAVRRGLREAAARAAQAGCANRAPLDLIQEELAPALDEVGKGFEAGTLFLPQLLMSAEAAKAAFEVLRGQMRGEGGGARGVIVLATVRGDIHDIGKNIVKVLLENYGYRVVDLGKDVPAEDVLRAVQERHAPLAGLSALMTTTVASMEETIRLLHERAPECKVMVGGAVLTAEDAARIGADFYSPDAMGSVRYANRLFGNLPSGGDSWQERSCSARRPSPI